MLLLVILAAIVGIRLVIAGSWRVRLHRRLVWLLAIADVLFVVGLLDSPSDLGRAWGLWVSAVLMVAINAGALRTYFDASRPAGTSAATR